MDSCEDITGRLTLGYNMDGKYATDGAPHIKNEDVLGIVEEATGLVIDDKSGVMESSPYAPSDEGIH